MLALFWVDKAVTIIVSNIIFFSYNSYISFFILLQASSNAGMVRGGDNINGLWW